MLICEPAHVKVLIRVRYRLQKVPTGRILPENDPRGQPLMFVVRRSKNPAATERRPSRHSVQ